MTVEAPVAVSALQILLGSDAASIRLEADPIIKKALRYGNFEMALRRLEELASYPLLPKAAADILSAHSVDRGRDALGVLSRWKDRPYATRRHPAASR